MLADDRPPSTASPARHDYDGDVTPFDRLGRFVVRRARLVIGAWAVLIAVALPLAPQAPGALSAGGFISDDLESARAKSILEAELGTPPSALVVVFSSPELEAGTPPFELAAAAAMRDIPDAQHVAGRRLAPAPAAPGVGRSPHRLRHRPARPSAGRLPEGAADPALDASATAPNLTVELAGGPAFYGDVQTVSEQDLQRSELISLPLAALALLLVFGSLVAAGVPLVVGGASVLVALAGVFLIASVMPMSIFVLNLATLLGLGLGVDYSLLMTSRYREELAERPAATRRGRRGSGPADRRDRRPGRVLQRADRPAGAARASCSSTS